MLVISNWSFTIFARYPNGSVYPDANVAVKFEGFQEFKRVAGVNCIETLATFPATSVDEITTAYSYILASEMMCDYSESLRTVSNGAVINTTMITATSPAHPGFQLTFNVSVSDKDAKIPYFYSPTQNLTIYENFVYVEPTFCRFYSQSKPTFCFP